MSLNVLIAEKSPEEYFEQYKALGYEHLYVSTLYEHNVANDAARFKEILLGRGYNTSLKFGIDSLTDEEYSAVDCAIVHPLIRQIKKIAELNSRFPQVGVIISTAPDTNGAFHSGTQDCFGVIMLQKPFSIKELVFNIELSSRMAKVNCLMSKIKTKSA